MNHSTHDATTSATFSYQPSQYHHETKENEFIGIGKGLFGDVVVKVAVELKDIEVIEEYETVGIGDLAINKIPHDILREGRLDVDAVSSATVTTDAIKDGVKKALQQAVDQFTNEASDQWIAPASAKSSSQASRLSTLDHNQSFQPAAQLSQAMRKR
ncbi:FMN-binding protein [Dolosicoccus paucivorans]|uniref:FMN-binding protein n=1 Tax=Dolosicoccus paucivorans TaxID=84521 RepID=A0A1G8JS33_9LACT|nr:FMN-binding protein [Dolosicoccus paucivorans]PMB84117.1 FMN-binding protein [Dolosicoccus paucivorans]PMC58365.1 FMN-binding protein [Dolosicoccus paucivorans]SDI33360.1 FMN-binding domain-containing protein [Dolosicoccus paucivorans]